MDIQKIIQVLLEEKARLDRAISTLEALKHERRSAPDDERGGSKRGRRGMSTQERRQVSERMKEYWARRRALEKVTSTGSMPSRE